MPDRVLTLSVGVRVRIAGEELAARLTPGLVEGDAEPRIDIVAWEGEPVPPTLDVEEEHYSAQDDVQALSSRDTLRLADGDRAVFWVRDARALTRWETAAPLRTLLRWTLRPLQMVHAAAVVGPRGAALLAGPSGAGSRRPRWPPRSAGWASWRMTTARWTGRPFIRSARSASWRNLGRGSGSYPGARHPMGSTSWCREG